MSRIINNVQEHSAPAIDEHQTYTAPELVEIKISIDNTILTGSGEDWGVIED